MDNKSFPRHLPRNAPCTKNGSNFPPNRQASEPAISRRASSNAGPISSRSSETAPHPFADSHLDRLIAMRGSYGKVPLGAGAVMTGGSYEIDDIPLSVSFRFRNLARTGFS